MQRAAGLTVPQEGGFALVGDANRGEVARREIGTRQGGADHLIGVVEDLGRVVLDPAGLRIDLLVLFCATETMSPFLSNTMKRELVVPWSMAPIYLPMDVVPHAAIGA
jgi:hypothetical protein